MNDLPDSAVEILDSISDGAYCTDLNRCIRYWNRGAERITGYAASDVIGKSCADNILNHVNGAGCVLCKANCPMQATMTDGKPLEADVFLHHKDGHRTPVKVRTLPILGERGEITGGIEIFSDLSDMSDLEGQLHELRTLAMLDDLTCLPNRRYIRESLIRKIDEFMRYGWPFGILSIDIDFFKKVNDTYGHTAGDQVLKMVATGLKTNCRALDRLGRWGGEEFLIILSKVGIKEVQELGERFRMLVENSFIEYDGNSISNTISLGGTIMRRDDTIETLIKRADELLYESKDSGRNKLQVDA
jgi:diguanylate cyclase (GGDEF)-like protein/PAS domain S-box-containing protein